MPTYDRSPITLLSNVAATGSAKNVQAGRWCLSIDGTFNGATAKLQLLSAAGNYVDVGNEATMTAAGSCLVDLPDGQVKVAISGGPPSGMYANLTPVSV